MSWTPSNAQMGAIAPGEPALETLKILPAISLAKPDGTRVLGIGTLADDDTLDGRYSYNVLAPEVPLAQAAMVFKSLALAKEWAGAVTLYLEPHLAEALDDFLGRWASRDWDRTGSERLRARELWWEIHDLKKTFASVQSLPTPLWSSRACLSAGALQRRANRLAQQEHPIDPGLDDFTTLGPRLPLESLAIK